MTLEVELNGRLDSSGAMASLTGELSGSVGDLQGIELAISVEGVAGAGEAAGSIDLGPIGDSVNSVLGDLTGVVGSMPVADDLIGPVRSGLTAIDAAFSGNLDEQVNGAIGRISDELRGLEGDSALAALRRLADALQGAPEFSAVNEALSGLFRLAAGRDMPAAPIGDVISAVLSALEAIGAMMTLETMLAEGDRLGLLLSAQLPEGRIGELNAAFSGSVAEAEALLAGLDVADDAAVDRAFEALVAVRAGARVPIEALREAMAFGEATLTLADPDALVARSEAVLERLRGVATNEIATAMERIASLLAPLLQVDLDGAPQFSLASLLDDVEARSQGLADEIAALDLTPLTGPLTDGLGTIAGLVDEIHKTLDGLVVAVENALGEVRDAVAALPLDQVVNALREVTGVIADILSGLGDLLGAAQAAIGDGAAAAQAAIARAEAAIDEFRAALEQIFGEAKKFVDELGLEAAIGQVADSIQSVSDLIGQADMAPYFATAQDAINTTAGVIDKVPFEILPDEMEQDVVDLVRPIKTADLDAFRSEILTVLQIEEDGTFALRDDLEAVVSDVQEQLDQLIVALGELHPQKLADEINIALDAVREEVEKVAPSAELRPVTEALDTAKAAVAGLDLDAVLQPLSDGFDEVLRVIDDFQPSALIEPLDAEIDAVRAKILDVTKLEEWSDKLDEMRDKALEIVGLINPTELQEPLRAAFEEAQTRLGDGDLPDPLGPLGVVVSSLMAGAGETLMPEAIERISAWVRGAAAGGDRLSQLTTRFRDSIATARRAVEAVDPDALAVSFSTDTARLADAVAALPAGPARDRLTTAVGAIDLSADLRLIAPNHQRYVDFLARSENLAANLVAKGFGEIDSVGTVLRAGFAPLLPIAEAPRRALEKMGFTRLRDGLPGLLTEVFEAASPERLTGLIMPVFTALHGRIEALLDALIQPLRDMIDDLLGIVNLFDLDRLTAALDEIHAEIRAQIAAFHPDQLLGEVKTAFGDAQAAVAAFDPLGPVIEILETLKETVIRVLEKLDGDQLLQSPIEIFETIMRALEALDLNGILGPLYDRLDAIAGQVADGLEGTVDAFGNLQEALPSQVGSTSVSVSASVSVGG